MLKNLAMDVTIVEVEIANDERLMEKYGLIIPVVGVETTEQELSWPFSVEELQKFIGDQLLDYGRCPNPTYGPE